MRPMLKKNYKGYEMVPGEVVGDETGRIGNIGEEW